MDRGERSGRCGANFRRSAKGCRLTRSKPKSGLSMDKGPDDGACDLFLRREIGEPLGNRNGISRWRRFAINVRCRERIFGEAAEPPREGRSCALSRTQSDESYSSPATGRKAHGNEARA